MNEIQLLGDGRDVARITAWMYYPRDQVLRKMHLERFEVVNTLAQIADEGELLQVRADTMKRLLHGPSRSEIAHLQAEAVKQGTVAGDLLHLIYQMHQRGLDEPSLGKALKEYQAFSLGPKYGDKTPLKRAEQTLRDCFEAFAPVAHIWAAFRLNGPFPYVDPPEDLFSTAEGRNRLLGVAKALGEFATTFTPKRTRPAKPVIDPRVLVRISSSIPAMRLTFKEVS
ncbi:hypothetical protein [Hydrogenophaga sp. T2]|uniref:hypothetical protein n=1 Tax=Hydrogenophaga sp. T2 TaxID=3132823 RepID=UPI003CF99BDC